MPQKVKRCVCGQPMPHPPTLPGTPWTWMSNPERAPKDMVAVGHHAHEPSEGCGCTICESLR
jgi:hypothetical protein